ncbi:high-affinity nicotinic acid transporter [Cryptococcus neoformans C23]|nr:high-affinity nicotinic acid transporter [Cryptococcus neoformans var. grubii AD2-60a]OWZ45427.1 high-affinity nicotinic acid transporter [Cryptococcus neoformans var. grubii C23]OXC85488.1 high-affinity nicotinic acid transporter [Cryptococcus neoformans var. grubii AD1-7a]OXH35404.1 high-affinity nicotinic acid transporter [Cryptococcus neoformans var. grubii]
MPSPISAVMVYNNNVVHLHHSPSIWPFIIATTMSKLESRPSLKVIDDKAFRHSVTKIEEVAEISEYPFTKEENRCIVRKFDWHILPFVWACYLFNSLDRNNVSNAKSDGMTTDLNFPDEGYSIMLTVFTVPFACLVVPGVMLTRKIGPRFTIPGYMLGWGAMAMINAGCKNFAGVLVVRLILGAFEAGFAASLIFYLTTFYTRGELGKRVAAFYSCQALSGAFSGLIAYGVFQMNSKLWGWQILFLIEGAFTVGFAILTGLMLPWSPSTASFLTDREKEVARLRILKDGSTAIDTKFNRKAFFKPLKDWKFHVFASIALCYGVAASVAGSFLTQIIGRFHYSTVKTNLFTVAPYAVGTIALCVTAWSSDRLRERGFHLASSLIFVFIGCILLVALPVTSIGPAYFATFLITAGAFTPSVIFHTWHQCNDPTEDGRAFRVGTYTFLANLGGIVSAQIFRDKWSPAYIIPLAVTAGIEGLAAILVIGLRMWMYLDNRKRNQAQGVNWQSKDVPTEVLVEGSKNPMFRHFY